MKRAMISPFLPTSASAGKRAGGSASPRVKRSAVAGDVLPDCRPAWAQQQVTLPPFAQFWQDNQLIEMPEEPANARFARFAAFRADPQANLLKTASGKIEIHSPTIAGYAYPDCPPHPMWLEPDEWHGNAQEGQLQVLSAHPAHRLHSQLNHTSLREALRGGGP